MGRRQTRQKLIRGFNIETDLHIELKAGSLYPPMDRLVSFDVFRNRVLRRVLEARLKRLEEAGIITWFEIGPHVARCEGFHSVRMKLSRTPRTFAAYLRRLAEIASVLLGE